jgi:hypothetical protein
MVILVEFMERLKFCAVGSIISIKKTRQKSPVSFGQTRYPAWQDEPITLD